MTTAFAIALVFVFAFAFTNGVHDASNAIATLVATRGASPAQAMVLAAFFNTLGPLVVGAAVADTIGGIVAVDGRAAIDVIGAGLVAAVGWNVFTWWLGLPSSSGHALVGGLIGAALVEGGTGAVQWGGLDGLRPVGVVGTAIALAVAPLLGALAALVTTRAMRRGLRRGTRRWRHPIRVGEWLMSAGLAFSHGANDAQKAIGLLAALLVADGQIASPSAPTWAVLGCAAALTAGTAIGGWRIVKKVGRGIYRIRPAEGLASQAASAGVIFGASLAGAPVSTSQVVASSIVGVGGGRRRWRHVRWAAVGDMGVAWALTIPATAVLGGLVLLALDGLA
jgi:PiT family inorganic phosphate transporter